MVKPPTMLAPFTVLGKQLKIKPGKASIDNLVFWLHYRATCVLLILCTILVCSREYIGEHIRCLVDKGIPEKVINTFCFFTSTFTVARHYNESAIESGYIPHPGVGPMRDTDETTHHAYYQWVPFVLFGQAIAFYLPHTLWKKLEGGKIQALVNGLHFAAMSYAEEDIAANGIVVPSRHAVKEKISTIKTNFLTRLHSSRNWSMNLIFCESLNFFNIIFQIYITNVFLGGQFIGLGTKINHVDWDGAMDPLDVIFPKVTKCLFHKYGPSGSIQSHDALCVMALNVINEKIYTILWFWFLMLFIVSSLGLIWRLMTVLFHSRSARFSEMVFSSASPTRLDLKNVISVTHHGNFPDWLFLYYLAKNMDGFIFKNLFINLAEEMDRHESAGSQPGSPPYYNGGGSVTDEKVPIMDQPIDYPDKKAGEPIDILKFYDEDTPRRVSTASDQDIRKEPLREKDE